MKIAFCDDRIYAYALKDQAAVGGAERQQWLLARALASANWGVVVGVLNPLQLGERRIIEGVPFVGMGQIHVLAAWRRFLLSERPDWWYWRGADHKWGLAVEIAKLAQAQTIFSAAFDSDVHPRRALHRRRRWWPLYLWGLVRTDRIFLQHRGQLAQLAPQWRSKATIIPSIAGETTAVKPHSEHANYVAWVGMLRQPKRPDLLVEIAGQAPDIRFVVCGGPSMHRSPRGYGERIIAALRNLPNVEFLGQIAPNQAREVIANAALFLSTSDEEGFPNTFLEAWSSGIPVVSLKIDPDGVIERKALGTVSGSVERTVTDIRTLIDSPKRRDEIALRACQHIAECHSEAAVVGALQRAIQGIRC